MQSTLLCFGVGLVLILLAPLTMSFSRGANYASCQEMVPGHIRAQPQYPQNSHITLQTPASSYLPGQLITVTVRSSRDFMGFLLQARGVEGKVGRARTGVDARVRSTRVGPVLVGGSWTFTPPGTHTLRCLSEGDTLTHSDKQLKRNLSFVWRAPDAPMGDIRFYITVVQSYFVYWAGIESAVVRDGSRHPLSRTIATRVDGGSSSFAVEENKVTVVPALRTYELSNNRTTGPAATPGPHTKPSKTTQIYKSLVTQTEVITPVLDMNSSVTLSFRVFDQQKTKTVNEMKSPKTLVTLQKATIVSETDTNATPQYLSGVTEDAGTDTGYHNSSLLSSSHLPFVATTTPFPNTTVQNSTRPFSLQPSHAAVFHLKYGGMERKHTQINFKDSKVPTSPEIIDTPINPQTTTTAVPSTSHSVHNTKSPRTTSYSPREPIQDQTSSLKFETHSSSSKPWRTSVNESQNSLINKTSPHKAIPHYQTSLTNTPLPSKSTTSQVLQFNTTSPVTQAHALSLQHIFNKHNPSQYQVVSDLSKRMPESSSFGPHTGSRQTRPPHPQLQTTAPPSSFPKTLAQATPTQTQSQAIFPQTDQSQSDISPEVLNISFQTSSQPHSQTQAQKTQAYGWKQYQPSVTPGSSPLLFTSRFNPMFTVDEGKEVKEHQSPAKIKTMNPVSASVPLTTPPHFSGSTQQSPSNTFLPSSLLHHSSTTPQYPFRGSTQVSMRPSIRSILYTHSFSSSEKSKAKTVPALSALPSPSPVSSPPSLPSAQLSPVQSSLASSTIPSSKSFSPLPSSTSSSSPMTSNHYIISSPLSLFSSSTISPIPSSSSIVSVGSYISSTSSPSSPTSSLFSLSSPSSPSSPTTSSSSLSFNSTTPHPGPSPAPRRSLYNPLVSSLTSMPSQKLTASQSLPIQNHMISSNPKPNLNPPTPRTVVHPNPEPHPNLNPNFKQNFGHNLKPNFPKTDTNPKHPSNPSQTPDKEGKYPDIVPRQSAWELGMLLGCSAGLGMVLVVGVRYVYRQACAKQTEMTFNDREREYGRGERGLIHVQECGDLVRVRRIRENSFVLLAEYDILASTGD